MHNPCQSLSSQQMLSIAQNRKNHEVLRMVCGVGHSILTQDKPTYKNFRQSLLYLQETSAKLRKWGASDTNAADVQTAKQVQLQAVAHIVAGRYSKMFERLGRNKSRFDSFNYVTSKYGYYSLWAGALLLTFHAAISVFRAVTLGSPAPSVLGILQTNAIYLLLHNFELILFNCAKNWQARKLQNLADIHKDILQIAADAGLLEKQKE